jgi:3-oxoadipate enol-lactonase
MIVLATTDRGSGDAILLLHGQPGEGASWLAVVDILADRFRVLAPDRPGYGSTDLEARGMAENADLMAEFIKDRDVDSVTVVGHSWSGGVAILLATRHPELVRSIVLVGAVGSAESVNRLDHLLTVPGLGGAMTVIGLFGMGVVLPRLYRWVESSASRSQSVRRARLAAVVPNEMLPRGWSGAWGRSMRTFAFEQRALVNELPSVTRVLGTISQPTSVVAGEWDVVVSLTAARNLAAAISGSEMVSIPRAGHFIARDAPDILADVIVKTDQRAGGAVGRRLTEIGD